MKKRTTAKINSKVTKAKGRRERGEEGKRKLRSRRSEYARRELGKQAAHSSEIKKKGYAVGAAGVG